MWTFLLSIQAAFAYNNLSTYIDTPISDIVFLLDGKEVNHKHLYHQKGETLDLYDIRQELEQLYATNRYESIDISIEPIWSTEIKGHLDEPSSQHNSNSPSVISTRDDFLLQAPKLEGILLVYILESADSIVDIEIEGVRGRNKNVVLQKLSSRVGDRLPEDLGVRAKDMQRILRSSGWPRAHVDIFTETIEPKKYKIYVEVEKGYRRRIGRLKLINVPKNVEGKIRRKLRRKKIFVSATLTIDKLQLAKDDILDILYEEGYLRSRVQILTDTGNNTSQVEILCETGPQTIFDLSGKGLPHGQKLLDTLEIYRGDMISQYDIKRYEEKLHQYLFERGYAEAKVSIYIDDNVVYISATRNKRYKLKTPKIQIQGNEFFDNNILSSTLVAADPLFREGFYSKKSLQIAETKILELYKAHGFYNAKITESNINILQERIRKKVGLNINIDEGQRVQLARVEYKGLDKDINEDFKNNEQYQNVEYQRSIFEDIKNTLLIEHQQLGYYDISVNYELQPLISGEYVLRFLVEKEDIITVRNILYFGNVYTNDDAIQKELTFEPGDLLEQQEIDLSRSNLYDLDLFQTLYIDVDGQDAQRDIIVQMSEQRRKYASLGGGFSTDAGLRLTARTGHRNLLGKAHNIHAIGQIGLAWDGDSWDLNQNDPIWRSVIRYTAPHIPFSNSKFYLETLLRERIQAPRYRISSSSAALGLQIVPTDFLQLLWEYRVEQVNLEDFDAGLVVALDPWEEQLKIGDFTRPWSGLRLSVVFDHRDSPIRPTEGQLFTMDAMIGDGLLNEYPTLRLQSSIDTMWKFNDYTLHVDVDWGRGFTAEGGTLPFHERFYMGGSSSVRGFERLSLGPANQTLKSVGETPQEMGTYLEGNIVSQSPYRWTATGGDAFTIATVEGEIPIPSVSDYFSVVGFVDFGRVFFQNQAITTQSEIFDPFLRYSMGFGGRYVSPIGPMAFDIGFNPEPILDKEEPWVQLHFALGNL
jgi:outer membrane protein insertion porin family